MVLSSRHLSKIICILLYLTITPFLVSVASTMTANTRTPSLQSAGKGFISPITRYTAFKYQRGFLAGFQGGWHLTNRLTIGAGIYRLITDVELGKRQNAAGEEVPLLLKFGYRGLLFEYGLGQIKSSKIFANAVVGQGKVGLGEESDDYKENSFYLVEPGIRIEFNPWPNLTLGLGLNYRYVFGSELIGLKDPHLRDVSGLVEFRLEDLNYWFGGE